MRYDDDVTDEYDELEPFAPLDPLTPEEQAQAPRRRWFKKRHIAAGIVLVLMLIVGWLAVTAPLSNRSSRRRRPRSPCSPATAPPIAKRGAIVGKPVDASKLPKYVTGAFIAVEDRRFYSHWGIDPWGMGRALFRNIGAGGVREGASTITQQLAKNAFLDSDRTSGRKRREILISFWLEAWLSKNEILSRYLSNVYFGDNVYGLTAASRTLFRLRARTS